MDMQKHGTLNLFESVKRQLLVKLLPNYLISLEGIAACRSGNSDIISSFKFNNW